MEYDSDVIVVGSGAGGATTAYAIARAGKSVLLLERGRRYPIDGRPHDEQATLIDKRPYDDRLIVLNGIGRRLYIGGVLGGGTSLYGAALLRPSREDFQPGRHYGDRIPCAIWDWPISYDSLAPSYDQAERLFGVAGAADDNFGILPRPVEGYPNKPLPLHPANERLIAANRARGLSPFRLPLAIDPATCIRCDSCAGFACPTGARRSSLHAVDQAASDGLAVRIVTGVDVEQFVLNPAGKVDGLLAVNRASGCRQVYRARRYVLAAGAIGSPLILQASNIVHPLIGRNYMTHLSPVVIGLFPRPTGADSGFVKQVGFADYYLGTSKYKHKLGLIQSLPVPGPLMMAKTSPKFLPLKYQQYLRQRMLPMVGIVEDLPNPQNRVTRDADGKPRLDHCFGKYDFKRGKVLGRLTAKILRRAGAKLCLIKKFPTTEHVAHQCGTLRAGRDANDAVLDPDCRLFGQPNVFVADGSFFPTSLGVGPALTIIANALRVSKVIAGEL